jgi:hypothetical protein
MLASTADEIPWNRARDGNRSGGDAHFGSSEVKEMTVLRTDTDSSGILAAYSCAFTVYSSAKSAHKQP